MKHVIVIILFAFSFLDLRSQINPLTKDVLRNSYKEIEINFTLGNVNESTLPKNEFVFIDEPLFFRIYKFAQSQNKYLIKYNEYNQVTHCDSLEHQYLKYTYLNKKLAKKQVFLKEQDILLSTISYHYDSLNRIRNITKHRVINSLNQDTTSNNYCLSDNEMYEYQSDSSYSIDKYTTLGCTVNPKMVSKKIILLNKYNGTIETSEFNEWHSIVCTTIIDSNSFTLRKNYDNMLNVIRITKINYLNKDLNKMSHIICLNSDSTIDFERECKYNNKNLLVEVSSSFKRLNQNDTNQYNYYREVITYDIKNNPEKVLIYKNGKILYYKQNIFNVDNELIQANYYTDKNELILNYTIKYTR
jgi:hypothetical protein